MEWGSCLSFSSSVMSVPASAERRGGIPDAKAERTKAAQQNRKMGQEV